MVCRAVSVSLLQVEKFAFCGGPRIRVVVGVLEHRGESGVSFEVCASIVFIEVWFEPVGCRPIEVGGGISYFGRVLLVSGGIRGENERQSSHESCKISPSTIKILRFMDFRGLVARVILG